MNQSPVVGYRHWRMVDGALYGWLYPQARWNVAGVTQAVHLPSPNPAMTTLSDPGARYDHDSPGDDPDGCGLYAFLSLWGAEHLIRSYRAPGDGVRTVCGAIIGGGAICRHGDEGWRAAQARIVALGYEDSLPSPALKSLCDRHGLPLIHLSRLERFAGEWGERL